MCVVCSQLRPNRRRFLAFAAAGIAAPAALGIGRAFAAGEPPSVPPADALKMLEAGNKRFAEGDESCAVNLAELKAQQREELMREAQHPWATILTCSDSRVPPELLFGGRLCRPREPGEPSGHGLGELFVCRNAGNMANTATMGSIEYSVEHGVRLVVVLGHKRCGAVKAACEVVDTGRNEFPGSISPMVEAIVPVALAEHGKPGDFVDNTVRESAKQTAAKIRRSRIVQDRGARVVAAYYDLDNGKVTLPLS